MTIFQKNTIIAGYINSYCLVCECFFETEDETITHINDEGHEARLLTYPYLEKYGNNGIRKVKAGYFCEYCSLLMATAAKVNLHIAEKLHYYNKGNCLLKQSGSVLTAFDDVLITESAWHSFAEDACALCNIEFDDEVEHKLERTHILKLLQNKVQFADDNNLYRMINKNDFQCLTCNCVPPLSNLAEHFNDEKHKQKYIQCQEEKKKFDVTKPKETKVAKIKTEIAKKEDKINENVNIETIAGKAVANKATKTETTLLDTNSKLDIAKAKNNKTDTKKADTKKSLLKEESTDPATYANDNKIVYDPRNANAFCKTCVKKFPSSLHGMKEHIQGRDHIKNTKATTIKPAPKKIQLEKMPSEKFITEVHVTNDGSGFDTEIVINETFCITEKSLYTFTKIASRYGVYKCQICLINLCVDDMEEHLKTAKHSKGIRAICNIMNLKNEFIREVRPEKFHCGYCNVVVSGWDATEDHLKTPEHMNCSALYNRRLQSHLPEVMAHKKEQTAKATIIGMFLHNLRC